MVEEWGEGVYGQIITGITGKGVSCYPCQAVPCSADARRTHSNNASHQPSTRRSQGLNLPTPRTQSNAG